MCLPFRLRARISLGAPRVLVPPLPGLPNAAGIQCYQICQPTLKPGHLLLWYNALPLEKGQELQSLERILEDG